MKQFIDKLIGRLEYVIDGLEVYTAGRTNTLKVNMSVLQLQRYINRLKEINQLAEEYKLFGNSEQVKPRTRADRIRSMTDEELVNLFGDSDRTDCLDCKHEDDDVTCEQCWLEWLQSEVKDGE